MNKVSDGSYRYPDQASYFKFYFRKLQKPDMGDTSSPAFLSQQALNAKLPGQDCY